MLLDISIVLACVSASFALQCPNISNPTKLPSVDPILYSYELQITIPDQNSTMDGFEFYDHENGTVWLMVGYPVDEFGLLRQSQLTYDYNYNQTFVVDYVNGTKTCTVLDLNSTASLQQPSLFGVGIENGPLAINNSFYWNMHYNASFEGITTINGILTDHYKTCLIFDQDNLTYSIDVYFSISNWSMPSGQRTPVLLRLNATFADNSSKSYIYKFAAYRTSNSSRLWRPHKPSDVICSGRKDVPPIPVVNLSQFQVWTQYRTVVNNKNVWYDVHLAYDAVNFLIRDTIIAANGGGFSGVSDFKQGLYFNMSVPLQKCSVSPLPQNIFGIVPVNASKVRMLNLTDLVKMYNLTYGGITTFNNIPCHVWLAQSGVTVTSNKDLNTTMYEDFYYSVSLWNGQQQQVGMRKRQITTFNSTTKTETSYEYFYANRDKVTFKDFQVSPLCYNSTNQQTIYLKFDSNYNNDVTKNSIAFKRAFVDAASKYGNVSKMRVAYNFAKLQSNNGSAGANDRKTGLFVSFTIFGTPGIQGNSIEMEPQIDLKTAVSKLKKIVSSNSFDVTLPGPPSKLMTAFSNYWQNDSGLFFPPPPPPTPTQPTSTTLTAGGIVGICVAVFLAGLILGYGFFYCRTGRARSQYAYTMQS